MSEAALAAHRRRPVEEVDAILDEDGTEILDEDGTPILDEGAP